MSLLEWIAVVALALAALGILLYMLYRRFRVHPVLRRIKDLTWQQRLRLAGRLVSDQDIPLVARAILVLVVLYLALPIDFIPDFIPVLGQIDDVIILGGGLLLFARLVPREALDGHIAAVSAAELEVIEAEARPVDQKALE
ncbi:MAG: DUF1232 domain-containing protein [Dehalococcoidia bacterium]